MSLAEGRRARKLQAIVVLLLLPLLCVMFITLLHNAELPALYYLRIKKTSTRSRTINHLVDGRPIIPPYSTENMVATIESISLYPPLRLAVYDGKHNQLLVYNIASNKVNETLDLRLKYFCFDQYDKGRVILPLLMSALRSSNRIQNRESFQLLLSDMDFPFVACIQEGETYCNSSIDPAPMLHFGSTFRNESILPSIQSMPHLNMIPSLREWTVNQSMPRSTFWQLPYHPQLQWNDLKSQIVWRGSLYGYNLLETVDIRYFNMSEDTSIPYTPFNPREIAVNMSIAANEARVFNDTNDSNNTASQPWLNIAMASRKPKLAEEKAARLTPFEMAGYKYQIDLGGNGGTSWEGTIEKLSMPGLLFHHETIAKDWFYDDLIPWKHYVPVRTDLSDLREKYEWAEANPDKAREIAQQATAFVHSLFEKPSLERMYETYFVEKLGRLVDAYSANSDDETIESILESYNASNVTYHHVATCTSVECYIESRWGPRSFLVDNHDCYSITDIVTGNRTGPMESCQNLWAMPTLKNASSP